MTQHNTTTPANQNPGNSKPDQSSSSATVSHTADTRNPGWDSYVTHGHGRTDEQVRADVQQLMIDDSDKIGDNSTALSISVEDGIVTLEGEVRSEEAQQRLVESIRAVPSVRDVRTMLRIA